MFCLRQILFAFGIYSCAMAAALHAGFEINVGSGINNVYSIGSTIRIPFEITSTGGDQIAAYQLAIDLGTPGFGGTSSFSNIHVDFSNSQLGDFRGVDDGTQNNGFNIDLAQAIDGAGPPFTGNVNFDYTVSNAQTSNATPGPTFRLFELVLQANSAGNFGVNAVIRTDPGNVGIGDNTTITFIGLGPTNYDLNTTSVTTNGFSFTVESNVAAIPEPTSLSLIVLGLSGGCLWKRRKVLDFIRRSAHTG